jgi:hypothetical protein
LAGYLTFDNGWHDIKKAPENKPRTEMSEQWASFQNDLIHRTDLFAACLAQKECFTSLLRTSHGLGSSQIEHSESMLFQTEAREEV